MALIGVVALIVIGPEKLPTVARTLGTLLGKAQRYVADVKAEVNRSMDLEELKKMSQRNLQNAFHGIRFGLHNETGIHGACPIEMLHHILLGMFKYVITGFREQIGRSSAACDEINALAKTYYGKLFMHNSDRKLPKTSFGKGIFQGKIMGKEYAGVLLVTAAILQSTLGQKLLKSSRHFKHDWQRMDWALLVETMLEWEAFLKQDKMDKNHVRKLQDKHRYLMYLMKKVLRRTKGMGMDFMKFHAILHLVQLIVANGDPNVVDTGPNESHHKPTKYYSTLTQKNETTFEQHKKTFKVSGAARGGPECPGISSPCYGRP